MKKAVFLEGSIPKHIIKMTVSGAIGLLALFMVDLIDMYCLSFLGEHELAAAVGFSGSLLFYLTAIGIGIQITMGALVSRAEGQSDRKRVQRFSASIMLFSVLFTTLITIPVFYFLGDILSALGAKGLTLQYAIDYSRIIVPSTPLLACSVSASAALRALGDAKNAMFAILSASFINALLNPVFIFVLGMGIKGAAIATVCGRVVMLFYALYIAVYHHKLNHPPSLRKMIEDLSVIFPICIPAILTNLATPIGSSFTIKTMAMFGTDAVAGTSIIGRLAAVAFAFMFALSGAIGTIIGQNAGAGQYDRVRQVLISAWLIATSYVLLAWLMLYTTKDRIVNIFGVDGEAAQLIVFYNRYVVFGFIFLGMLFIANAASNNLNRPKQATFFNFIRMLLGSIPGVYLCAKWYGAKGVLMGEMIGAIPWGIIAFGVILWQVSTLKRKQHSQNNEGVGIMTTPFSSSQSQLGYAYTKDLDD